MRRGEASRAALVPVPGGMLPLPAQARRSLLEAFRHAPDPPGNNVRFRIGPVLTLVAMALLAGARDLAQIARFAPRLKPQRRAGLSLPIRNGTRRFYKVPTYSVFYQVLVRMDPETFARTLNDWLAAQAGTLPAALRLDGKMIRELIGTVTLADAESGSPMAVANMDQKEDTERSEQSAARTLIESLPSLEGRTVTADPLHCQRELGGDRLQGRRISPPGRPLAGRQHPDLQTKIARQSRIDPRLPLPPAPRSVSRSITSSSPRTLRRPSFGHPFHFMNPLSKQNALRNCVERAEHGLDPAVDALHAAVGMKILSSILFGHRSASPRPYVSVSTCQWTPD